MKKTLLLIVAATLSMVGCNKDVNGVNGGDVTYTFEVSADQVATKAAIDNDGNGVNVDRFIMEVYLDKAGELKLFDRQIEVPTATNPAKTVFTLTLIKNQEYKVLFWADKHGDAGKDADLYYNTADLRAVKLVQPYIGYYDARDAFSKMEVITAAESNAGFAKSVKLTRPFGQMNFITTDIDEIVAAAARTGNWEFLPTNVKLQFNAFTQFNVLDQTSSVPAQIEYTAPVYSQASLNPAPEKYSLSMDYLLTLNATEKEVRDLVTMTAYAGTYELSKVEVASVPVQRNYRTNIIGNLLTSTDQFVVEIDPIWAVEDIVVEVATVENIAAANAALEEGATNVEVKMPVDAADQAVVFPEESQNKDVVMTFSGEVAGGEIKFSNSDDTTGPASLVVTAPSGTKLLFDTPQSHVVLNGTYYETVSGSFSLNTLVIEKGVHVVAVNISAGAIEIHGVVDTLTMAEGTSAKACENLNDAVYAVAKQHVAEGYSADDATNSIVENDFYQDKDGVWHVMSTKAIREFAEKVNKGTTFEGKTVVLDNDIDLQNAVIAPIGNHSDSKPFRGTFNGNNKKLSNFTVQNTVGKQGVGLFGKVYDPAVIKDLTVENATVIGDKTVAGDKAIAYVGGIVGHGYAKIQNCTFKGNIYAGHQMGGIAGSGGFTITGCTFEGNIVSERDWGLGGIIGNCQDGGAISGNTAKGTISAKNADYCGLIAGGIIGCAIYTTYDVKNNYAAMTMSYDGNGVENVYPIVGVYNIDAPGTGNEDFAALLTTLENNTWDKTISPRESYDILYDNENKIKTGYRINYGAKTTETTAE